VRELPDTKLLDDVDRLGVNNLLCNRASPRRLLNDSDRWWFVAGCARAFRRSALHVEQDWLGEQAGSDHGFTRAYACT
jgi:hypothetical protein